MPSRSWCVVVRQCIGSDCTRRGSTRLANESIVTMGNWPGVAIVEEKKRSGKSTRRLSTEKGIPKKCNEKETRVKCNEKETRARLKLLLISRCMTASVY